MGKNLSWIRFFVIVKAMMMEWLKIAYIVLNRTLVITISIYSWGASSTILYKPLFAGTGGLDFWSGCFCPDSWESLHFQILLGKTLTCSHIMTRTAEIGNLSFSVTDFDVSKKGNVLESFCTSVNELYKILVETLQKHSDKQTVSCSGLINPRILWIFWNSRFSP